MKKRFIILSAIAATLLAFTAAADAGHTVRYFAGYDSCGHPVYCYRTVPTFSYGHIHRPAPPSYGHCYSQGYGHSSSHGHSYSYRPSYGHGRSYCR